MTNFVPLTKHTNKPKLQIFQNSFSVSRVVAVVRQSGGQGIHKPPAWFLERTRGWIPREHYSPWCAPTSWSGLSPRRAKVKGHEAGRRQGNKRAARGKEGRNNDKLKWFIVHECWKISRQ